VEHLLAKEGVAGSIPVSRSEKKAYRIFTCTLFVGLINLKQSERRSLWQILRIILHGAVI
jgi:hypothetical protein